MIRDMNAHIYFKNYYFSFCLLFFWITGMKGMVDGMIKKRVKIIT